MFDVPLLCRGRARPRALSNPLESEWPRPRTTSNASSPSAAGLVTDEEKFADDMNAAQVALIEAQTGLGDSLKDIADAQADWELVNAGDDPIAQNIAKIHQAERALRQARGEGREADAIRAEQDIRKLQMEAADNNVALIKARMGISAAIVERDPVKAAQVALQQAQLEMDNAKGKGEIELANAQAAVISAQHKLEDVTLDVINSQAELAIALAGAAGHTVDAAKLEAQLALDRLNQAISKGAGVAEVRALTGAYAQANANAAQAARDERLSIIDFQLQMNQITVDQAIAMMRTAARRHGCQHPGLPGPRPAHPVAHAGRPAGRPVQPPDQPRSAHHVRGASGQPVRSAGHRLPGQPPGGVGRDDQRRHRRRRGGGSSHVGLPRRHGRRLALRAPDHGSWSLMARIAWIFSDPTDGTVEFMEINPNEGASPEYRKNLTHKVTTAPGGQVLIFEGNTEPTTFSFSGVILTEDQYNFLYNAWTKRHPIEITDDLGRVLRVYFESFSPKRKISRTYPWRHDYQATTLVVS